MYLTALHVAPVSGAGEGINAFLHLHTDGSFPSGHVNPSLVAKVAEICPGVLTRQSVQVHPGGNEVQSYLDVVAPDGIDLARVRALLGAFQSELPSESLPLVRIYDDTVGIVLNGSVARWPVMESEYSALRAPIVRLLDRWEQEPG